MKTYRFVLNNELYHHGIEGQKWGVRNGPPYPLDEKDHSVREKKARKDKSNQVKSEANNKDHSGKTRTNIKAAMVLTAGLLSAGGTIYMIKSGAAKDLVLQGKSIVDSLLPGVGDLKSLNVVRSLNKNNLGNTKLTSSRLKMIKNINANNREGTILKSSGSYNCLHCSTAYILNSLFGYNVVATPNNAFRGNIDEVSGLYMYRDEKLPQRIFDGIRYFDYSFEGIKDQTAFDINRREKMRPTFLEAFSKVQNGSTGMVSVTGHIMNYEKDKNGKTIIIDTQSNFIVDLLDIPSDWKVYGLYDFSNASIRQDAMDILKLLVT